MTTALLAGLFAGWAIAIPVGAIGAYLVGLSAQTSLAVGAAAGLGVATVDCAYAAVAVFGGRSLADVLGSVTTALRVVAAVVLIGVAGATAWAAWAAWRQYRAAGPAANGPAANGPVARLRPVAAYLRLIWLTALNPATVIYFVALVLGSKKLSSFSPIEGLGFTVAAFVASASWQLTLAGGGAALGRLLTGTRARLATALTSAAVITVFAIVLLTST